MTAASATQSPFKTWDGYLNGQLVSRFSDRSAADQALERRTVDAISPTPLKVGLFVQYTLVTDTVVYEVVDVTPKTIKIRRTTQGETVKSVNRDGNPYPVVYTAVLSDPDGKVSVVRLRKDGTYRTASWARPLRPATIVDGKVVTYTDYRV